MSVKLPDLAYAQNALEPYISETTIQFHYGKHHNTYVQNLNKLIANTEFENQELEDIIKKSYKVDNLSGIFNNAAQVWNHTFYWNCLSPNAGGVPNGKIANMIDSSFGSYEKFIEQLKNAGLTQFGSGWAWLVQNKDSNLEIMKTLNADTPLALGIKPILTVDVWEHAYYLDYQNKRPEYLDKVLEHLINWDYVNSQLV